MSEKKQGAPFEFPDPKDRSVNEPHIIIERPKILGLYNQSNNTNAKNVSESVKEWIVAEGKKQGFSTVEVVGSAAMLGANIKVITDTE